MATQKATQAAGDLDPSFGDEGKVFYFPPPSTPTLRMSGRSRLRSDGKIFTAGYHTNLGDLVLVRHLSNGDLDDAFADGGVKLISIVPGYRIVSCLLELESDDSALIFGSFGENGPQTLFLCKLLPEGELDISFGTQGFIFLDLTPGADVANALAIRSDGKIILSVAAREELLICLDSKGDFDPTFGNGGIVYVGRDDYSSLIVLSDNRLLLAGTTSGVTEHGVMQFASFLPDGAVDRAFGENGKVTIDVKNTDFAYVTGVAQQRDGKILAVGYVTIAEKGYYTLITRINADGSLDSAFNNGVPYLTGPPFYSRGMSVAVQPDDKILVATYTAGTFNLMRLLPSGALDMGFGLQGKVSTNMSPGTDIAWDIAVQADGKIVLFGTVQTSPGGQAGIGIARYFG
ncbi:hypothetical protein BK654_25635 [Pseudomonas brassicacearum]|uniref:hypothetical protein n=1 Tax=Pseudomonas brassicacearum TaxID=930166 RepID=UPI000F497ADA|nr:hypothetical protein [Pseudomonas brassicacearum]ROM72546.1 hypothetical protein BK654_25635 [Pseudomonas brassicacearum]